ncbi:GntR family transcriptional regulator [Alphaproteobacteria bacterium LSUCC0396]
MGEKTIASLRKTPRVGSGDTLANALRRQLADDILDGRREPGSRLEERSLAEQYGVSRTPVREALQQLVSAGLAIRRPRSGAVVQRVEAGRVSSLCETSILLETLCARLAAVRITTIELGRLRLVLNACDACHQKGDVEGFALENRNFHSAVIAATQNQDLADTVEFCRLRIAPYHRAPFKSAARRVSAQAELEKIVSALESGNPDQAAHAMTEHLKAAAIAIDNQLRRPWTNARDSARPIV